MSRSMMLRLQCRCLSCERTVTVLETEIDTISCDACGDLLGVDGFYHPTHPQAVDFAHPAPPYASPEEVTRREADPKERLRLAIRPSSRAPTKINGANGHNGHGIAVAAKESFAPIAAALTSPPPPTCKVCYDHGYLLLADGTNAKKVSCPACKVIA